MDDKIKDIRVPGSTSSGEPQQQSASVSFGQVIPASVPVPPTVQPLGSATAPPTVPTPFASQTFTSPPPPASYPQPAPAQAKDDRPTLQPTAPRRPKLNMNWKKIGKITLIVALILLVLGGLALVAFNLIKRQGEEQVLNSANRFDNIQIPLDTLIDEQGVALLGTRSLMINGPLRANDAFILSPSSQPSNANRGQLYYDQNTNQLAYYNGSRFVPVGDTNVVQTINGLTGQVSLGSGLNAANGQISNSGVLAVQGQTGNITLVAGPGILIDGTTISSTGVASLGGQSGAITIGNGLSISSGGELQNSGVVSASGGSGISVTNDGSGNITISNTGAGTGTVQSPGGTAGRIAKFTGVQTIADSLLSETGTTVTVNGDLNVTGAVTLGTPLAVGNGGTGATSLANNGVVIGQGSGSLTAVIAGGTGLCLMSTAGAPSFQACPGGSSVTSVNGLVGALTIANATGAGTTITLNDASTTQKGIAQFNSTNFAASGGTINTVQNIHTTATPTFTGVNTNSINPSGALTVGATSQQFTLQGNASSVINATSGVNATTLSFETPAANVTYRFPTAPAGNYDICTTIGNCAGTGGGVTTGGGTIGTIAKFLSSQTIGNSLLSEAGAVVTVNGSLNVTTGNQFQINGAQISSAVLSNDANLAKLNASQTFTGGLNTFQNTSNSTLAFAIQNATSQRVLAIDTTNGEVELGQGSTIGGRLQFNNATNANAITLIAAAPAANRVYTLPDAGADATICLSTGNCGGAGVTLQAAYNNSATPEITVDATRGALTIRDAATPIGANLLEVQNNAGSTTYFAVTASGTNTSGSATATGNINSSGGALQTNGTTRVDNSGNLTNIGNLTGAGAITIASSGAGNDIILDGADQLIVQDAATFNSDVDLTLADTENLSITNTVTGTAAVNMISAALTNNTSSGTQQGMLIQNAAGSGITEGLLVLDNADADTAVANGLQITAAAGGVTTALDVSDADIVTALLFGTNDISGTNLSITGSTGTITSAGNATLQGGSLTLGTSSQAGTVVLSDGSSNTGTISLAALGQNTIYTLPDPGTTTVGICLTTGNCAGSGGGVTGSGTNNRLTKFTSTGSTIGDSSISDDGTTVSTTGSMVIQGGNVTIGTTSQLASLVLHDGDGQTTTLQAGNSSGNLTFILPTGTGSTNQCLKQSGTGNQLFWDNCDGGSGGSTATLQGAYNNGNTITSTDNRHVIFNMADTATDASFVVNLECDTSCGSGGRFAVQDDTVDVFTILPAGGGVNIRPSADSTQAFNIDNQAQNNLFTVDTVNSRIGINLGGSNTPVLAGSGLELQGALRLSGGGSVSLVDYYTTPAGTDVTTKINIPNYDPGAFNQLIAMGLPSTANANARGISLFDARTVEHQPTLAVFSPDENNIIGFSWNGSNSTAYAQTNSKTTSGGNTSGLTLQSGRVAAGNGSSGDVTVTTGSITGGTGGSSGVIYVVSGNGNGTNSSSGNVVIDTGNATGSGTTGVINLGGTNASALNLGRSGLTTANAGGLSITEALAANGNVTLGNAAADLLTFMGTIQGGTPLVFEGATADGFETSFAITDPTAANVITFGDESGTVCMRTASNCGFATGSGAAFLQGGNAFGAAATLGTNDANNLSFETNNNTIASFTTIGAATFQNSTDSINAFRILNQAGTANLFNVDTSNGRVGIGGVASFSKFEVQGGDAAVYNNGANPRLVLGDSTSAGENGYLQWDSANNYFRIESVGTNGLKINDNYVAIGNLFPDQPLKVGNGSTLLAQINTTGAAYFQNSSNSTDAFRILTSGGAEILGADTTNSVLRLLNSNPGSLPAWTSAGTSFTTGRFDHGSITANGYVYVIGGADTSNNPIASVYYAKINASGSLGTWSSTTALPANRAALTTVTSNGYVYAIGGRATSAGSSQSTVYYAKLNADGSIGTWNTTTALPDGRAEHNSVVANGYIYALAGRDSVGAESTTSYYAKLNADGTVGTWNTTSAFSAARRSSASALANGYVYMIGGSVSGVASTSVVYAKLNTNGTLGTWTAATQSLPNTRHSGAAVVLNGRLYHIGGEGTDYADVFYAPLNSDGNITAAWAQTTDMLTARRSPTAVTANGYIYSLGGENGTAQTSSEYASPSRVKVGGALDLVGLSGENLAEGGSGGNLTAGDTHIAGLLTVTDNASFKANVGIGGALTVNDTFAVNDMFKIDIDNSRAYIGSATADSTGALLILDTKNTSGDPTGVAGGMYYNSNSNKFRCYENSAWKNCLGFNANIVIYGGNGNGAAAQWTNMPAALTEIFTPTDVATPSSRPLYDLTDAQQVRFQVSVETVGSASAEVRIQYSTDQTTWNYLDSGNTGLGHNISTTGAKVSSWATIASGAKDDVYLRVVGLNGNATTDPRFGLIQVQAR